MLFAIKQGDNSGNIMTLLVEQRNKSALLIGMFTIIGSISVLCFPV